MTFLSRGLGYFQRKLATNGPFNSLHNSIRWIQYSIVRKCHISFVHLSVDGYLNYFHFWLSGLALLWPSMYKYLCGHMSWFLLDTYLAVELPGHLTALWLMVWRTPRLFFELTAAFHIPGTGFVFWKFHRGFWEAVAVSLHVNYLLQQSTPESWCHEQCCFWGGVRMWNKMQMEEQSSRQRSCWEVLLGWVERRG